MSYMLFMPPHPKACWQEAEVNFLFSQPIDIWEDAQIQEVINYLKGSPALDLPQCWPTDY